MLLASQERLALDFWRESTHKHYKRGLQRYALFSPSQGTSIFVKHVNYLLIVFYSHLFIQNHLHVVCYSHKVYGFQAEGQCDIAP